MSIPRRGILAGLFASLPERLLQAQPADRVARLDDYLTRLAGFGYSGVAIVYAGSRTVIQKAHGWADRESKRAMTPETVLNLGSITKSFTGAAILRLEMAGKLSVKDSIARFFPDTPDDKKAITVHHLLTHSAGLHPDYGDSDYEPVGREEYVRRVFARPLQSPPGVRYDYSNAGFSLLGAIIEIVSGQSYEQFLRNEIFLPAGMTRTGYLLPKYTMEELACGYQDGQRRPPIVKREFAPDGPWWNLRANGGLATTAGDMLRWHLALAGEQILSKDAKAKYYAPHMKEGEEESYYGYGVVRDKDANGVVIAHNGGDGVFSADFIRYIERDVMVFLATNNSEWPAARLSRYVIDLAFGKDVLLPPKVTSLAPAALQLRAGGYATAAGARFRVAVDGARLSVRPEAAEAFNLIFPAPQRLSARAAKFSEATRRIIEASAAGDFMPLHKAINGPMPFEKRVQNQRAMWKQREDRLGRFRNAEVIGARFAGGTGIYVRLIHERGSLLMLYGWMGGELAVIRLLDELPARLFYPQAADRFVAFELGVDPLELRFEEKAMVLGSVRATREATDEKNPAPVRSR